MTYYIFLKSLKSLEEFRKNPHIKIPPKSPSINFPSLGKFKIQILIQKSFFFTFGPADFAAHSDFGPAGLPLPRPRPADRPNSPRPSRPARACLGVFCTSCFLLDFTPSVISAFSLSPR
jgi:hypothetical protein